METKLKGLYRRYEGKRYGSEINENFEPSLLQFRTLFIVQSFKKYDGSLF